MQEKPFFNYSDGSPPKKTTFCYLLCVALFRIMKVIGDKLEESILDFVKISTFCSWTYIRLNNFNERILILMEVIDLIHLQS